MTLSPLQASPFWPGHFPCFSIPPRNPAAILLPGQMPLLLQHSFRGETIRSLYSSLFHTNQAVLSMPFHMQQRLHHVFLNGTRSTPYLSMPHKNPVVSQWSSHMLSG